MDKTIRIAVRPDAKMFLRFSFFDVFIYRKRWRRPAIFALIFVLFTLAALVMKKEQSGLIACVLLLVGLGLPAVYIGIFLSQVKAQAQARKLDGSRLVYTVTLYDIGFTVENMQKKEELQRVTWKEAEHAFRFRDCIYLYASPVKVYLLPDSQADATSEEVWAFLTGHLGVEKCS